MPWKPNRKQRDYLELVFAMSSDCMLEKGTVDVETYISNLRSVADILEKMNRRKEVKDEKRN